MANRDLLTASLLAGVFWNLAGFAIRSYDRLWPGGRCRYGRSPLSSRPQ